MNTITPIISIKIPLTAEITGRNLEYFLKYNVRELIAAAEKINGIASPNE